MEPKTETPSLLEIGRRAAMMAEREAIERVLNANSLEPASGGQDSEDQLQGTAQQIEAY